MGFNDILKRFYNMEVELKLFERRDLNGIYYWDIFRFNIFDELTEGGQSFNNNGGRTTKKNFASGLNFFKNCLLLLKVLYTRNRTFAYLCSRNKYKGTSILFDQNAHGLLSLLKHEDVVINESYAKSSTLYDDYTKINFISKFSCFISSPSFIPYDEFSILSDQIKEVFPQSTINIQKLVSLYITFYKERKFYRWLFKTIKTTRIFISQNGIQKGLFAAAIDLGLPVYEFQHGIINDGHLAYSYPMIDGITNKTYLPSHLLTLSDWWLNDCYVPYLNKIVIGNDYFVPQISIESTPIKNRILIVSSTFMQKELFAFLEKCKNTLDEFCSYEFIYKLHPNEFMNVDIYKEYFKSYSNIRVSTNEKTIAQWMDECSTMITILSTAAYEALQCNRKVIILKCLNYQMMKIIFGYDNVYTVENSDEMLNALNQEIITSSVEFFSPFNKENANNVLN